MICVVFIDNSRKAERSRHETSLGYWHGYTLKFTLGLNRRPSGQSFSSDVPFCDTKIKARY